MNIFKYKIKEKSKIYIIAVFVLVFAIFKMQFYVENTSGFNDLSAHLGYLTYVDENKYQFVPEFNDMKLLTLNGTEKLDNVKIFNENVSQKWTIGNNINYLGHPPLYYQIINIFNPVKIIGNMITFDMQKISIINMVITGIGLILIMYIGILFKLNPAQFFFYSVMCTGVPLLSYLGGVLNNDNLGYIGISLLIIALIQINENIRGYLTYTIMAVALFICMMTKLTFGLIAVIILLLYFGKYIYEHKKIDILVNGKFVVTLPIYMIILVYYIIVLHKYHTVQPGLANLNYEYYITTGFYVEPSMRVIMNIFEYIKHFFVNFYLNWIDIRSHKLVRIHSNIEAIIYGIILISPAIYLIYSVIHRKKPSDSKNNNLIIITCISVLVSILIQFIKIAKNFYTSGYLGGTQSRYYLADIFIMSLAFIYWFEGVFKDRPKIIKNIIFIMLGMIVIIYDMRFFIS